MSKSKIKTTTATKILNKRTRDMCPEQKNLETVTYVHF